MTESRPLPHQAESPRPLRTLMTSSPAAAVDEGGDPGADRHRIVTVAGQDFDRRVLRASRTSHPRRSREQPGPAPSGGPASVTVKEVASGTGAVTVIAFCSPAAAATRSVLPSTEATAACAVTRGRGAPSARSTASAQVVGMRCVFRNAGATTWRQRRCSPTSQVHSSTTLPSGSVDVGRAAGAVERDLLDLLAALTEKGHRGLVVLLRDVHREVHVRAAATARQSHLRAPQPDPRALAGHHPDRLSVRPALHYGQPEDARVEGLRRPEVLDLQHQLGDARDREPATASLIRQTLAARRAARRAGRGRSPPPRLPAPQAPAG